MPHRIRNAHPGDTGSLRSQARLCSLTNRSPEKSKHIHTHTETRTHTLTSLFLTSLTPGWQESSQSLKWRSTAAHSWKKQLQTKVCFKSKLLSILMMGHKQSKEEEEDGKRKKELPPLNQHTHSQPNHTPCREKLANLVINEYLQYYFHYKMPHNAQVLCSISTQCYFLCAVQLDI